MNRSAARWALSPLDCEVHLLAPGGEEPVGALEARCGASLSVGAIQHDQPPPGPPCERCGQIFLAEVSRSQDPDWPLV